MKTNVTIYVSSGPAAVPVPDLTNQSLADAKAELQRDKLTLGTITTQDSPLAAKYSAQPNPEGGDDDCVGHCGQRGRRQRQQHSARRAQLAARRGRAGTEHQRLQLPADQPGEQHGHTRHGHQSIARARHDGEDRHRGQAFRGRRTAPAAVVLATGLATTGQYIALGKHLGVTFCEPDGNAVAWLVTAAN